MIYFHEDNFRQIEFVPEENYFTVSMAIQNQPLNESSIYGFNSISVRSEQKRRLIDRKITLEEISKILTPTSLVYSSEIMTGYGQNIQKAKDIFVWGFEQFGLFVKVQDEIVEAIWISDSAAFPQLRTSEYLAEAIFNVSRKYCLILIDWNKEVVCRIKVKNDVREYLFQNFSFDYY